MRILKINILFIFLMFFTGCGYVPIKDFNKISFYISELKVEGDREINNIIIKELNKYQTVQNETKEHKININSTYEKSISSRDNNGNPKSYTLKVIIKLKSISTSGNQINKTFEKNISLDSQNKKIAEIEIENKYKKNITSDIIRDIVFFLNNYDY